MRKETFEQGKWTKKVTIISDDGKITHQDLPNPPCQVIVSNTKRSSRKRTLYDAFGGKQTEVETKSTSLSENDIGSIRSLFSYTKVRLNLASLKVPKLLPKKDEKAMYELHMLLKVYGFDVHDRATLAFFAIGASRDVPAASQFFFEFYKFARTWEVRFPDRICIDQLVMDGWVECFAHQYDGTYGALVNFGKWDADNNRASYVVRELFCYYLKILDLSIVKKGITVVGNMKTLSWKSFAPFEMVKVNDYMSRCLPLKKKIFFVEPSWYASIALKTISIVYNSLAKNELHILTLNEAREFYPDLLLPPSSVPLEEADERFTKLSADQQMNFQLLID